MDNITVGYLGVAVFLLLVFAGVPLAFSGLLVGFCGIWIVAGFQPAITSLGNLPHAFTANYAYSVLPLFMIMGTFADTAGFAAEAFTMGRMWLGKLPGGLASAVCAGGAILGAACGSSMAAAAVMTRIAMPELLKYKYDPSLAAGSLASAGTLSVIIPPSGLIVIYGLFTEQSIGKLLLAGIIPGVLIALSFILMITIRVWLKPSLGEPVRDVTWKQRWMSLKGLWGIGILAVIIMGGIYSGITTPNEAGALGAGGALLLVILRRRFSWSMLMKTLEETAVSTGMVFIIIVGAMVFVRFLALTGLPNAIADFLITLPIHPLVILVAILVLYLALGAVIETIGMLLLTLPIVFPAMGALGFDPIWFGILVVIMCEIGMLTPPVGLTLYVVKSLSPPQITLRNVFVGCVPFYSMIMLVVIPLLIIFPNLVLYIPNISH